MALNLPLLPDIEFILIDQFEELGMAQTIGRGFLQAHVQRLDQTGETELFQCGLDGIHVWLMVGGDGAKQSGRQCW